MSYDYVVEETDSELRKYIKKPISGMVDVLEWWCNHRKDFPNLFRMFLKLVCVPATSASSERVFSITGNIITDKRSAILPDNVNDLMVVRNEIQNSNLF